jgi:hypothetical protein
LRTQAERLPKDLAYLSKDEATLKKELVLAVEDATSLKEMMAKELKRLKREHLSNT